MFEIRLPRLFASWYKGSTEWGSARGKRFKADALAAKFTPTWSFKKLFWYKYLKGSVDVRSSYTTHNQHSGIHKQWAKNINVNDMYDIWHELWKERIQCQTLFTDIWLVIGCLSSWRPLIGPRVMWSWAGNVTGQLSINIPLVFSGPDIMTIWHYDTPGHGHESG